MTKESNGKRFIEIIFSTYLEEIKAEIQLNIHFDQH